MMSDQKIKFDNSTEADRDDYKNHIVFGVIDNSISFYKTLSFSIMGFATTGTRSVIDIDTYVYSSMEGTLESIKMVLEKGRVGDAFSLLRKFHDSVTLNIYTNLYLADNRNVTDKYIVEEVTAWLSNKKKLPHNTYGKMSEYIENSPKLREMFELLYIEESYRETRTRCNDHTHYNFFDNVLINDNKVYAPKRISLLSNFKQDLENIFVLHLACIFTLSDHYMMSSDYVDCLDVGITPEPDSQYWVASYIQEVFSDIIQSKRPDVAALIKKNTAMHLL
jgi:hypothetical protein